MLHLCTLLFSIIVSTFAFYGPDFLDSFVPDIDLYQSIIAIIFLQSPSLLVVRIACFGIPLPIHSTLNAVHTLLLSLSLEDGVYCLCSVGPTPSVATYSPHSLVFV